jgi:outer membrane protein OmpA-like peptidoglycan-associated protein
MNLTSKFIMIFFFCLIAALNIAFAGEDIEGSKDNPYLSRMPNYLITDFEEKEFEAFKFCDGKALKTVEGRYSKVYYEINENAAKASDLQISRNYANAVRNIGGTVLYEGSAWESNCEAGNFCGIGRLVTAKIGKGNKELWVQISTCDNGNDYTVTMIEKEAMKQDVTAGDMLNALNTAGHITLYINFDTGKSTIKPESQPVIEQIVAMMKSNSEIKLGVEGHTDNVGDPKKNKILSEDRAKAVVSAIVKQGIDASRLSASGFGQDKPIADNSTEEGRAKNRRVELVKK